MFGPFFVFIGVSATYDIVETRRNNFHQGRSQNTDAGVLGSTSRRYFGENEGGSYLCCVSLMIVFFAIRVCIPIPVHSSNYDKCGASGNVGGVKCTTLKHA